MVATFVCLHSPGTSETLETGNAKYLIFPAATAHAFNLSESLALQSMTTSVPSWHDTASAHFVLARPRLGGH
ncbi:hypothetical protein DSL72_003533 [Monilinia vaccinii-corymbosi]|uniref:Uncharacterized protein n=1 Tax=Monilinia vaccinii-corymbosi TaxID=61207 RepID=A0A8A3NU90_9HELO|nr:hypothetical protein DSL72_003533 [Monilinia vaccinii-corymbosi]